MFGTEVVGEVGKAKCPKKKNKSLTHFKTMPQAAGKNSVSIPVVVSLVLLVHPATSVGIDPMASK